MTKSDNNLLKILIFIVFFPPTLIGVILFAIFQTIPLYWIYEIIQPKLGLLTINFWVFFVTITLIKLITHQPNIKNYIKNEDYNPTWDIVSHIINPWFYYFIIFLLERFNFLAS